MKLGELVTVVQAALAKHGDVEIFAEENTGRETFARLAQPSIERRMIWPGNSAGVKLFMDI